MEHLVEQLVLVAQALDSEYESLQGLVERPARKKPQPDGGDYAAARCLVSKDGGRRALFQGMSSSPSKASGLRSALSSPRRTASSVSVK
jgi:hypothetical protein